MRKRQREGTGKKQENLVITPGGPRPKDLVHPVGPGEAVLIDESGKPGIIPSEELTLTPGGFRPKTQVHLIEPGYRLDGALGSIRKLHPSGKTVADFGPITQRPREKSLMPWNVSRAPNRQPAFGSGWIVYTDWSNDTGNPLSSFATTWIVPPAPTTQSGQTIFLFNGIQNSTMIYQPVLQWGVSAAGGGDYWGVSSWYADGQGGVAFHSQLVQVNPGDVLVGIMTLSGQSGSAFNYDCQFQGIANTLLPIQNVQELTWCAETLEAYGITQCSDYPGTSETAMTSISLQTGNVNPAIAWTPVDLVTDCGQSIVVVSNSSTNGEVDIYYRVPTVWQNNVWVTQTFATRDSQNAWACFQGFGWRKIQTGATDGVTNMLALFAQAESKGRPVTIYADGNFVYQAYLL
jgi:hypothetical protein